MLVFHHHLLAYPYICPMKFRLIPLLDVVSVVGSCLYHAHSLLSKPPSICTLFLAFHSSVGAWGWPKSKYDFIRYIASLNQGAHRFWRDQKKHGKHTQRTEIDWEKNNNNKLKITENSLGGWYLSICAKLPQMESWVPQDEERRWKKAIHETTTAGWGTLTGKQSFIQLWLDNDYDD